MLGVVKDLENEL